MTELEIVHNKRKLKRIDIDVLTRLLAILSEIDPVGITSLQMKTGTKYSTCIGYVGFLERMGLVKLVIKGKNRDVNITERGREALKIMSAYI